MKRFILQGLFPPGYTVYRKCIRNIPNVLVFTRSSFRPIVSSLGTFNYNLAVFLGKLLSDDIPNEFSCSDTFTFVEDLKGTNVNDKFITSFDVVSLFTHIPLQETLELAVKTILDKHPDLKISKKELLELFVFATSKTNFLFKGIVYDQIDGVAMGSPLAPILANLFMGHYEKEWLQNYKEVFLS